MIHFFRLMMQKHNEVSNRGDLVEKRIFFRTPSVYAQAVSYLPIDFIQIVRVNIVGSFEKIISFYREWLSVWIS